jgi:hypothetical protein
MNTVLLQ